MNEISLADDLSRLGLGSRSVEDDRGGDLDQEDFLTLMVAQFRNQDPFEPLENGQFLGQLAQFGSVQGLAELNDAFASLSQTITSDQALQAANLVGHEVLASTDRAHLPEAGSLRGAVELGSSAQNVQVDILDSAGALVHRLDLGLRDAGLVEFGWDGATESGDRAPPDSYTLEARVMRGTSVESAETLVNARIDSVSLGRFGQGMTLNLTGGDQLSISQVRRIL